MNTGNTRYPLLFFALFCFIIIAAYFYYQPSWGLMDDALFLQRTHEIWKSADIWRAFADVLKEDFQSQKMHPVYLVYFIEFKLFERAPFVLYIIRFAAIMAFLPLWGVIYQKMFRAQQGTREEAMFLFPLTFFAFTPFWNNFMYLTVMEKFFFIFGTGSIYFLISAHTKDKAGLLYVSFGLALLCLLSKPTGIFLMFAYLAYAVMQRLFFNRKSPLIRKTIVFSAATVVLYILVLKVFLKPGGYSYKYVHQLSFQGIFGNIFGSTVTGALFLASLLALCVFIVLAKKKIFDESSVLLPLCFICYVLILAPWGIINYLLSPAAPFVIGMLFPLYGWLYRFFKERRLGWVSPLVLIFIAMAFLTQIIIPRISKMADIKGVQGAIEELNAENPGAAFYIAPSCLEASHSLRDFTGTNVVYASTGEIQGSLLGTGKAYLIFRDECRIFRLIDLQSGAIRYQNNTWKISDLVPSPGKDEIARESFPQTFLQKLVSSKR